MHSNKTTQSEYCDEKLDWWEIDKAKYAADEIKGINFSFGKCTDIYTYKTTIINNEMSKNLHHKFYKTWAYEGGAAIDLC